MKGHLVCARLLAKRVRMLSDGRAAIQLQWDPDTVENRSGEFGTHVQPLFQGSARCEIIKSGIFFLTGALSCLQVLNLLLYGLTGRPVDEQLMEFLAVDEHLVDIGDDLVDYEVRVPFSSSISRSAYLPVLVSVFNACPVT